MSVQAQRRTSAVQRLGFLAMLIVPLISSLSVLGSPRDSQEEGLDVVEEALDLFTSSDHGDPLIGFSWRSDAKEALGAGVSPKGLAAVIRRAHEAGWSLNEVSLMLDRIHRLAQGRLPINPVLERYLEGIAKGAPHQRIVVVADSLEGDLGRAARMVEETYEHHCATHTVQRTQLIADVAYVLGLGASPDVLLQSLSLAKDTDQPLVEARAPVKATGFLVSGSISLKRSFQVVETAWEHGHRGMSLQALAQMIAILGMQGDAASSNIIDEILTHIRQGATEDEIFERIERIQPGILPADRPVSGWRMTGRSSPEPIEPDDDIQPKLPPGGPDHEDSGPGL
jgi:hypothetical protein